jgi:proliferating cell nuclear antigen
MTSILFKAKTGEAYYFKVLSELLSNVIKPNGCFNISEDGITLKMSDNPQYIFTDLELRSENFSLYKFKSTKQKYIIGLKLTHFYQMLKTIKKKDSMQLKINNKDHELSIKVIPKENTRITTSYVKIQNIQHLDFELPVGYRKPVIVISSEFQKMCKDILNISSTIQVTAKNFQMKFTCNASDILKRTVVFGENDVDSDEDEEDEEDVEEYCEEFSSDQLMRIIKIAGLGSTMQIYPSKGLPLLFRSNVGSLGKISIYIKSKSQIEKEKRELKNDSDDDSDDDSD